jgi:hypothetical protein
LTGAGKAGLYAADQTLRPEVRALVDGGTTVVGVDLLYQGEFLPGNAKWEVTPKVKNPREAWAYTFGYNPSVYAQRVHDALAVIRFIQNHERRSSRIDLVGVEGAGPVAAGARAMSRGAVGRAALDLGGFRFGGLLDLRHPDFTPGGAKYGDVDGLLALGAPGPTLILGESAVPRLAATAYAGTEAIRVSSVVGAGARGEAASDFVAGPEK